MYIVEGNKENNQFFINLALLKPQPCDALCHLAVPYAIMRYLVQHYGIYADPREMTSPSAVWMCDIEP